ncbi:MAG: hypothetical protein LBR91_00170 [Puniceicoccales bacterium]|jgi:hypothetical protein|nr:hypothetical protein [Puniceicoccales bacterium]
MEKAISDHGLGAGDGAPRAIGLSFSDIKSLCGNNGILGLFGNIKQDAERSADAEKSARPVTRPLNAHKVSNSSTLNTKNICPHVSMGLFRGSGPGARFNDGQNTRAVRTMSH